MQPAMIDVDQGGPLSPPHSAEDSTWVLNPAHAATHRPGAIYVKPGGEVESEQSEHAAHRSAGTGDIGKH